jgi:zinc transport system ATP-binding protein
MREIVEVQNLGFSYGAAPVFSGVGFSVLRGDFVGIIGSNGAGKSTLLRLMLGELAPAAGGIRLFGQDIRRFRDWPKIGYVPQNALKTGADFPASVREIVQANLYAQVGLCRFPSRALRKKAADALAEVGMAGYEKRLIGELSGGQQQRVMLARVLVGAPELMMLDEPTTGVDASTIEALYALLRRLNRENGLTIVMVTHDVARVSEHASRILCLEEGSLVELSRAQVESELEHRHKHPPMWEGACAKGGRHGHSAV